MKSLGITLIISGLGFVLAATAETQSARTQETISTPQKLSLTEAKEIAFQRNWDLLAARSGIDMAQAQLIVVKEFPNPALSWSTSKIGSHESATFLGNSFWNRSYDSIAA
ncbi:MAG TPA: hypothetical protein VG754_00730, partial [Verrucomicrobiae bacterium]|nr:hypothetical protein [Verrucomicrobiae bacterium]